MHFRGLGGVEADVAALEAIADIDGCEFAILGYCHGSGPPQGLEDVDSVGRGAVLGWELVVWLGVSDHFGDPSSLHPCEDWRIFIDSSVSINLRVLLPHESQVCFLVFLIQAWLFQVSGPPHL